MRLHSAGVNITALFGPEHGVRGDAAEGATIEDAIDPRLGVPAFSLYGKTHEPTEEMLGLVDVMLCDIQDVGARFYTFPYTMAAVMAACGKHGVQVWILDRPNPISGVGFEGPILKEGFNSGVGRYATPTRYGFTAGELAGLFKTRFGVDCDLRVVKMRNWSREHVFDETGQPWVIPSPNMPDARYRHRLHRHLLLRGHQLLRGQGNHSPVRDLRRPVDRRDRTAATKCSATTCPASCIARRISRRSNGSSRTSRARACSST